LEIFPNNEKEDKMDEAAGNVRLEVGGGTAVITMVAVGSRNALNPALVVELDAALDEVEEHRDEVRCVVLTAEGKAFSVGADLASGDGSELIDADGRFDLGLVLDDTYHPLLQRLRQLHCPFLTAVNGVAAGGGMSLALMGDLVLAADTAYFVQSFRHIGLAPDMGSTFMLPRLVGFGRAMELSLLGEKLDAATALEWGLVNRVCADDNLMDETLSMAARLATGPTIALGLTRAAYWASVDSTYEQQLRIERENQRLLGLTTDFTSGVRGFLKKEPPTFVGR
jgi:2-(1,2-epoxy-1,2-dihydrophenyl)acetyl-CoA isomerase